MRRFFLRLANRVFKPESQPAPQVAPLPPKPANPQEILSWGLENAPDLFAQAREADRRLRELQAKQQGEK